MLKAQEDREQKKERKKEKEISFVPAPSRLQLHQAKFDFFLRGAGWRLKG